MKSRLAKLITILLLVVTIVSVMPASVSSGVAYADKPSDQTDCLSDILEYEGMPAKLPTISIGDQTTQSLISSGTKATTSAVLTITRATSGNNGGATAWAGKYRSSYSLSARRNNIYCVAQLAGYSIAYAFTGTEFGVQGTQAVGATITFNGRATAAMTSGLGGSSSWTVTAMVVDLTVGQEVQRSVIYEKSVSNLQSSQPGGSFSRPVYVVLQPGHVYRVLVLTEGEAEQYGTAPYVSMVSAENSTFCTYWTSIVVRY